MATIRELTQRYIIDNDYPPEINVDDLFESLFCSMEPYEIASALKRLARQDFCIAYNMFGYYSAGDVIINDRCEDPEKVAMVATKAKKDRDTAAKRFGKWGKLANDIAGQMFFDIDVAGNITFAEAE